MIKAQLDNQKEELNQAKGQILTRQDSKDTNIQKEPKPETIQIRKQVTTKQVEKRLADELYQIYRLDDYIGEDYAKEYVYVVGRAKVVLYQIQQATLAQGPNETLLTLYEEQRKHYKIAQHEY